MIFKRKNVLCSNCGFLGWITDWPEGLPTHDWQKHCYPYARRIFQIGEFTGEEEDYESGGTNSLHCYRMQWILTLGPENKDRNLLPPDMIRQSRQCRYYIKYTPGDSPEEHKEHIRDAKMRRTVMKATLLGASVGASAAIIAGLLFNL